MALATGAVSLAAWMLISSVGFAWTTIQWVNTEAAYQEVDQAFTAFVARLEADENATYALRQAYDAKVLETERLQETLDRVTALTAETLSVPRPDDSIEIENWFARHLTREINAVRAESSALTDLVADVSGSLAELTGQRPPESVESVRPWFRDAAREFTAAHRQQVDAIDGLSIELGALMGSYARILEQTPLASEEFGLFPPNAGVGGPIVPSSDVPTVMGFEHQVSELVALSEQVRAVQELLQCTPLQSPVDYYNLTSKFGDRKDPFTKRLAMHEGIDLGAWPGTPVRTTAPGVVRHAGNKGGYGLLVVVDHGCGLQTLYGHLKRISVTEGQQVTHRDVLGIVGSTGRSTGPHVHYEVRIHDKPVDPYRFIEAGRHVFKIEDSEATQVN